ncbi:hypothetical protein [Thiohalorhabdus sp.]|uniref:hypothetical protein n=1 Tax=Thiohalorhabdus sp. TaxID=3094134 RepID=UPI002FC2E245
MIDSRVIRALYPHPIPSRCLRLTDRGYCVGGALQCYVEGFEVPRGGAFPSPQTLSRVLSRANPRLSRFEARRLAGRITSANDTGDFDQAWDCLDEALTRHSEEILDLPGSLLRSAPTAPLPRVPTAEG